MIDGDQILGWKSMQFLYGAGESLVAESEAKEMARQRDCVCKQDSCGCGCYVATCDYDKLDQQ